MFLLLPLPSGLFEAEEEMTAGSETEELLEMMPSRDGKLCSLLMLLLVLLNYVSSATFRKGSFWQLSCHACLLILLTGGEETQSEDRRWDRSLLMGPECSPPVNNLDSDEP